ncbi:hypothetical protein [Pseudomonas baltica]|uniref:hypothetical protein n=1 Tax=Pseudomonas baltica TaxID=2762576 RepID=UPI00289CDDD8|nr:hypothetical protein [Pseudomonas baltica]
MNEEYCAVQYMLGVGTVSACAVKNSRRGLFSQRFTGARQALAMAWRRASRRRAAKAGRDPAIMKVPEVRKNNTRVKALKMAAI